jgi:hypothetical protein
MSASEILGPWSNFYLMIGPAAAALTGLMFVVITLVQNESRDRRSPDGIGTFSTPTVVHFAGVLIISAVMLAPWHRTTYPAMIFGIAGFIGAAYVLVLIFRTVRMSRHDQYRADAEDWTWYNVVPFGAYVLLFAGGAVLLHEPTIALFLIAASSVSFLVAGIHNAWDIVTYLALVRKEEE